MAPELGDLAAADVEDVHLVVLERCATSIAASRHQRDDVLVIGEDVVDVEGEAATAHLRDLREL
jgi:hypothetical protein